MSIPNPEEEIEKDVEHIDDDEVVDDEDENGQKFGNGIAGRTVSLQMLLAAKMLFPGKSSMTIEYLGQKFVGDLLPDGKIKSQETETIFCSPSAWAMHCKRIINPEKKSGCGWASVKYKGKKLDAYKAQYLRKCQIQKDSTTFSEDEVEGEVEKKELTPPPTIQRTVLPFNTINNRNIPHDANILVEAVPFTALGKIQPFLVTIVKSAIFLMDFHCHLTKTEVCGYLAGVWDVNAHNLSITHVFPCRSTRYDREKAGEVEQEIQRQMMKKNLTLLGWYHSHPKSLAQPTLRDCDTQLEYQIKMKGPSDATYSPCVGFICAPYNENCPTNESTTMAYWILPPPELKQMEYGRPMLMSYSVNPDPQPAIPLLKSEMKRLVEYYKQFDKMLVKFSELYRDEISYIEKLKISVYSKLPSDDCLVTFWNYIRELFDLVIEDKFTKPASVIEEKQPEIVDVDAKPEESEEKKGSSEKSTVQSLLSITSLQQQLSLPSGLNMNPSTLGSGIVIPNVTNNNFSTNSTTSSSPRDSPITISSNAASPGKFEIPVRASPSPAKSDTSSTKTRNSPAPSPSKINDTPRSNNSPNIVPSSLYDINSGMSAENMNDFLTASLASLAGKLPPGMQPSELAVLFQQKLAEYGVTGFNPAAAAAAFNTSSSKQNTHSVSITPSSSSKSSYKDLYKDLEKYDINSLLQSQYNFGLGMSAQKTSNKSISSSKPSSDRNQTSMKRGYDTGIASTSVSSSQGGNLSQTMIDLEDPKSELSKLSDFMKSPEYASLLLQHAAGYGGVGYNLGSEISISKKSSKKSSSSNYPSQSDLTSLLQSTSKLSDYSSQMASKKPLDYSSFLEQHKLPDLTSITPISAPSNDTSNLSGVSDISAIFASVLGGKKLDPGLSNPTEMLNSLFQNVGKASDISSLLFAHAGGKASDLSSYFTSPSPTPSSTSSKSGVEQTSLLPNISPVKVQEISSLFQHSKYPGIPDPLAKSTLAANNMYMTPTASLLKIQQEALNAMMMKPPKATTPLSSLSSSSTGSTTVVRNTETPPSSDRPSSKSSSNRDSPLVTPPTNLKYNFSAADLAVSSIPMSSSVPTDFSRKAAATPPIDMSSMSTTANEVNIPQQPAKKRMEFSSIADLAAPPAKILKLDDADDSSGVLNLSNTD